MLKFQKILTVFLLAAAGIFYGCNNSSSNLTATVLPGDDYMTCGELEIEIRHLDLRYRELLVEHTKEVNRNNFFSAHAAFWFGVGEKSNTKLIEAQSVRDRYRHLQRLYSKNDCAE
jgi:hypothetical protein